MFPIGCGSAGFLYDELTAVLGIITVYWMLVCIFGDLSLDLACMQFHDPLERFDF
jgi:hypothetical protein